MRFSVSSGGARTGSLYKRLADTTSGQALLIPRDGHLFIFCYPVNYESTKDESWMRVRKVEGREKIDEEIAEFVSEHLEDGTPKIGVNMDVLTYKRYSYFKERMRGQLVDVSQTLLQEVSYGLYPEEVRFQREVSRLYSHSGRQGEHRPRGAGVRGRG